MRNRVRKFVAANALYLPTSIFPLPPSNALPSHDVVAQLLASAEGSDALVTDAVGIPRSLREGKVLAINLGKNKISAAESIDDFVNGVYAMGPYADILVVNVSSPNTPGLRNLQKKGILEELLIGVVKARDSLVGEFKPPVLVKVAPDLDQDQLDDIAQAVLSSGIDGIIVSNTTITRPSSAGKASELLEAGGLSGPPVKPLALAALSALHSATGGKVPLIGCGGISNGADAIEFAKAGATLVQMYTSFIYEGVGLPRKLKDEITEILVKEGTTWKEIIGTAVPVKTIAPPVAEIAVPVVEEKNILRLELESLLEDLSASEPVPSAQELPTEAEILAVIVPAFEEGHQEITIVADVASVDVLPPPIVSAAPSVVLEALATTVPPPTTKVVEEKVEPIVEISTPGIEKEEKKEEKEEKSEKRWV